MHSKPVLQFVDETFLNCSGSFNRGYIVRSQGGNGALELDTQLPNLRHTGRRVEFVFLAAFDGQDNSPYYWVPSYSARLFCCRIACAILSASSLYSLFCTCCRRASTLSCRTPGAAMAWVVSEETLNVSDDRLVLSSTLGALGDLPRALRVFSLSLYPVHQNVV